MIRIPKGSMINLDPLLDIARLAECHPQMAYLIATNQHSFNQFGHLTGSHAFMRHPDVVKQFEQLPEDHPVRASMRRNLTPAEYSQYVAYVAPCIALTPNIVVYKDLNFRVDQAAADGLMSAIWDADLFQEITSVILMPTIAGYATPLHTHETPMEFVWLRLTRHKPFYIADDYGNRRYVDGHSCYFNDDDPHGSDPIPVCTYSIRINGAFSAKVHGYIKSMINSDKPV